MKIRSGFVSNSSSSSFVIIGKKLNKKDIKPEDLYEKDIYCWGYCEYVGNDFFEIKDERILKIIQKMYIEEVYDLYEVYKMGEYVHFHTKDLPENCEAFSLEVDYHVTNTFEDFCNKYNIDENVYKVYVRQDKLNSIENE